MRSHLCKLLNPLGLCLALVATSAVALPPPEARARPVNDRIPRVQIALLLDNSGSMQGLLNQARTQLWSVVNEFQKAKQHGKPIRLELALYEYGDGVKRLSHFTTNLDGLSEQLFGLAIRGGAEHCGEVIMTSVRELEWSSHPDDLKLIYIAGNEPFTQGPVDYREAIAAARQKGIVVNTIHCGGDDATWRDGAKVAQGSYFTINHNAQVAQVTTPQDAELARLSQELNRTYVGYGRKGKEARARQEKMDVASAQAAPAAAAERAVAKGSVNYNNADWDLVDAARGGEVKVAELEEEALPEEMRAMSKAEREAHVAAQAKKRAELQQKIQALSDARRQHLAEEAKKQGTKEATLDSALSRSIRQEGAKKAVSF
jgi:hypothetical protein